MINFIKALKQTVDAFINPNLSLEKFSTKQLNIDIDLGHIVIRRTVSWSVVFVCIYQLVSMILILLAGAPTSVFFSVIMILINLMFSIPIYQITRTIIGPPRFPIAEVLLRIRMLSQLKRERRSRK